MVENLPAMQERGDSIPASGRSPGDRKWQPTPVFLPGKSMDRGTWWATVHGVPKEWDTQLRD